MCYDFSELKRKIIYSFKFLKFVNQSSYKFKILKEEASYYLQLYGAKTKALISFALTVQLICAFVLAYSNCWFSDVVAQIDSFL